jgi:hypothetical protein
MGREGLKANRSSAQNSGQTKSPGLLRAGAEQRINPCAMPIIGLR